MKNKHLVNSPRFLLYVVIAGGIMAGTSPMTFGIGNSLLYKQKQRENPDKVFENAVSAMDTAGTIAIGQVAVSALVLFGGLALWLKKENEDMQRE